MTDPKTCTLCGLEIHYNESEINDAHGKPRFCFEAGEKIRAQLMRARTECEEYCRRLQIDARGLLPLRDDLAGKAMQGILASPDWLDEIRGSWNLAEGPIHVISQWAYKYADAMIAEREKRAAVGTSTVTEEEVQAARHWNKGDRVQVREDIVMACRSCFGVVKNGWRSLDGVWEYDIELEAPMARQLVRLKKSDLHFAGPPKQEE